MNEMTVAGAALAPLLDAFHTVQGQILMGARAIHLEGCLSTVILDFDRHSLMIRANPEDDTVRFSAVGGPDTRRNEGLTVSDVPPWKDFIGQPFGWGWITVNQQGYCDGVLLSFAGITPQVKLSVVASSIKEGAITDLPSAPEIREIGDRNA